jgi:hypothetical protein
MAASVRIVYDESTVGGAWVKLAVSQLTLAKQNLTRAKALADAISGGGVTPANLNSDPAFGATVVDGVGFYTCVAGMLSNIASVTQAELSKLDRG